MLRLVAKLALAAAAVAAVWQWAPISGRTLSDRWRTAGSVPAFVSGGWDELTAAGPEREGAPQARRRQAARERPVERHSEADRRALDRLLAEQLEGR